jgi:hypothetical protein
MKFPTLTKARVEVKCLLDRALFLGHNHHFVLALQNIPLLRQTMPA